MSRYVTALILLLSISVPVLVQSSARAGDAPKKTAPAMKTAPTVKDAARSAPAAGPGQTDLVVRKYQATLDQRITEQKKAQSQLDLANKAARNAARVSAEKEKIAQICTDNNTRSDGSMFSIMANATRCRTNAGAIIALRDSEAAQATVVTRTNELKTADAAVAKARDDLAKAKVKK